eukprot:1764162-Prymnesium_polylepis.2
MREFLKAEAQVPHGRLGCTREVWHPPEPGSHDSPALWSYLRAHGSDPGWRPTTHCLLVGISSDDAFCGERTAVHVTTDLQSHWLWHFPLSCCCRTGPPLPLDDCNRQWEAHWSRWAVPWSAFVPVVEPELEAWLKRVVRDGVRFADAIMCCAATVVHSIRERRPGSDGGARLLQRTFDAATFGGSGGRRTAARSCRTAAASSERCAASTRRVASRSTLQLTTTKTADAPFSSHCVGRASIRSGWETSGQSLSSSVR